jgi:hypothetical protein
LIHESDKAAIMHQHFDATGVRFHDRATTLAELKKDGREITFDADGTPSVTYDSEPLQLKDALLRFAYDRRDLVDGRTLPREGVGSTRPGTLSKADMTLPEKLAFIRDRGADAFAKLPSQNFDTKPLMYREDFYKLSRTEKVRRIALDPDIISKLPSAPKVDAMAAALEREKATRPNQK